MKPLRTPDFLSIIPHRYENILIDSCTIDSNQNGAFSLRIETPDVLNRDIFLSHQTLPVPYLCEIAALASIISSGKIKPGTLAFFAAITNMTCSNSTFVANDTIEGVTERISEKNGFFKYSFTISSLNGGYGSGQIMAYYNATNSQSEVSIPPPLDTFPVSIVNRKGHAIPSLIGRAPFMTFVDTYHGTSNGWHVFGYQYPTNHPLIQGHFPGNPVMMGVCQWLMLEDAIHYLILTDRLPPSEVTINAQLCKQDHSVACEFKQIRINATGKTPTTTAAKKILFKQPIHPGEQLYVLMDLRTSG